MSKFTTLSLDDGKSNNGKPKKRPATLDPSQIPDEKKWAVAQNLLLELLSEEIKENTAHLTNNGKITKTSKIHDVDVNAVLITAWLDYIAGYYCFMAEETEGAKTKKDKLEHEKYDDYASRAIDAYLTAKHALLFYIDEEEESE